MLHPVLDSPGQERHGHIRECPVKGTGAPDRRLRALTDHPGLEKTQGNFIKMYKYREAGSKEGRVRENLPICRTPKDDEGLKGSLLKGSESPSHGAEE